MHTMTTTTAIECGECGGAYAGTWDGVECRKCGHAIHPVTDVAPYLDDDEVVRLVEGVLYAVRFEV